jgi:hypothetical protein
MKAGAWLIGLGLLLVAGCARHVVVERSAGRVDPARSTALYGDAEWKIVQEPSASPAAPSDTTAELAP